MSEPIRLNFGQTPWDNLSREELLREVQRYHSALTSAASVLRLCNFASDNHGFWTEGSGGIAIEKAERIKARLDGFNSESVFRSFFRYADDLLFEGLGDGWVACGQCEVLWSQMGPVDPGPRYCNDCKRKGIESLLRPITWDDLRPKGDMS